MDCEFWIDRGGRFTDVCVPLPDGGIATCKYPNEDPAEYADAVLHAIRRHLHVRDGSTPIPDGAIDGVYIGTTLATNALLERKGAGLIVTSGFRDLLSIGYQNRPKLFALEIVEPASLAAEIAEVNERVLADGSVRTPLDEWSAQRPLTRFRDAGVESLTVLLLNSCANPASRRGCWR